MSSPAERTPAPAASSPPLPREARRFVVAAAGIILAFGLPLFELARFALNDDLYSHIVLIPLVSAYLVWWRKSELGRDFVPAPLLGSALALAGLTVLALHWTRAEARGEGHAEAHTLVTLSFLLLVASAVFFFLGRSVARTMAFPLGFLVFMIPLPDAWIVQIETFLQHGSAPVAEFFLRVSGMPVFREDMVLNLPNYFRMQVAPECSGIHSTLVLFITSLAAGELFLRSPWKRTLLVALVIPLALVRNGFRIFVIGQLCVRIGPEMIHSYIHQHGGPIFFALSLIPFGVLLFLLWRSDHRAKAPPPSGRPATADATPV